MESKITPELLTQLKKIHENEQDVLNIKKLLKKIYVEKKANKYEHDYVPLDVLCETINPVIAKYDMVLVALYAETSVATLLCHISGGYLVSITTLINPADTVQWIGAKTTQIRRYQIMMMLNIDDGSMPDDDGNLEGRDLFGKDPNQVADKKGIAVVDQIEKKMKKRGRPAKEEKEATDE